MHHTSEYGVHRLRGQCGQCAAPPEPGYAHCRKCRDAKARRTAARRALHRDAYNRYMRALKAKRKAT